MDKTLPIRLIQKRDMDDRAIEGGGSSKEPNFVIHGKKLIDLSTSLSTGLDSLDLETKTSQGNLIPKHARFKLNPNAIAKTHRNKIVKFIFDDENKHQDIEIIDDNELLIPLDNNLKEKVKAKLNAPENFSHEISSIKNIDKFDPIENETLYDGELKNKELKVKLFKYQSIAINEQIDMKFKGICAKHKLTFEKKGNYSKSLNVYKVKNLTKTSLDEIRLFEGVKSIDDMPKITIEETSPTIDSSSIEVLTPVVGKEYPNIGLLDSGVSEDNEFLQPWLHKCSSNVLSSEKDTAHGTFVSGLITYPDILHENQVVGKNGVNIHDFAVYRNNISEDELIDNIKDAIENYHENIKIWNLSLGVNSEAHKSQFSDFGTTLDELQDRYMSR